VLKTRCLGYDGKGQFVLRSLVEIAEAWAAIGGSGLIYEKFSHFRAKYPSSAPVPRRAAGVLSALGQ